MTAWHVLADDHGPRVGVGVIVLRGKTVLLGLRRGEHGGGMWAFPGGKMHFGEQIEMCAARELLEETGLTGETFTVVGVTSDVFPEQRLHYVTVFVAATEVDGEPENREPDKCQGWRWFPGDQLPTPLFGPTQELVRRGVLERLLSREASVL